MTKKLKFNPWLILAIFAIVADQISKYWFVQHFETGEVQVLTSFFNWTLSYNTGAAFGFLNRGQGWQVGFFVGAASVISAVVVFLLLKTPRQQKWHSIALSFLLAGALGNVCDRLRLGYVVDFIQWHYQQWYWPTFNLADSFVVTAVIMLLIEETL